MNWNYTAHTMLGQKVLEERTKRNRNMKKRESAWPAWHSDYSEQEKPLPENHAAQLRRL